MWKLINIDRNSVIIKYIDSHLLKVTKLDISSETICLNKDTQFKIIQSYCFVNQYHNYKWKWFNK